MIPIYKPYINDYLLSYAYDALSDGYISSAKGKYLELAENYLREMTGMTHVLLTNSGTSANHLMTRCLLKYQKNYRVAVPNNCYVAAWNGLLYDDSLELVPYDANIDTWNADYSSLGDEEKIVLIVPNLGNVTNVRALQRKYPDKVFIEDNCEGFLGTYEGRISGTASLMSTASFFGNKTLTAGEGGALFTNDDDCYHYALKLRGQGQSERRYIHDELGYNYRMTNVQAAILYGQLMNHTEILERKFEINLAYTNRLKKTVILQTSEENTEHSTWMFGIRIPGSTYTRAEKHFNDCGVDVRPMFYPMSSHKYLTSVANVDNETNAKILSDECIVLPSYPELTSLQVRGICQVVEDYVEVLKNV